MKIIKSDYTEGLYFLGYDDDISEDQIVRALRSHYGKTDGDDYDGLDRRDCDIADAHTDDDADSIGDLIGSYDTVERVYLRPCR